MTCLKVTSSRFAAVKRASARGLLLLLPVWRQKVKGIGPSPLEVLIGSGEQEPARSTDRATVASSFRHDLDT